MGYTAIAIIAAVLAYFQYLYKAKDQAKTRWFLAFLRFVSIGLILLLLWNPLWVSEKTVQEKQTLVLALDNSKSVAYLQQEENFKAALAAIAGTSALQERFQIDTLWLDPESTTAFTALQSPLANLGKQIDKRYGRQPHWVVLLSDGNVNQGEHPAYSFSQRSTVYPLVLGDTTRQEDLAISQLNVNKYAYLGNQFPVEVLIRYQGNQKVNSQLLIKREGEVVHRENISLSPSENSLWKEVLLTANAKGKSRYTAEVIALSTEKGTLNNTRHFGLEVIDQRAKIALVSTLVHPDLSALRQSLQFDGQREVQLYSPDEISAINQADLQIWYQPTAAFEGLIPSVKSKSLWVITGNSTDFAWLSSKKLGGNFRVGMATENFKAKLAPTFDVFSMPEIDFASFAPLAHPFGQWNFEGAYQVLLDNTIGPVTHQSPMLAVSTENPRRIFWMGEGQWQWRLQHYANQGDFEAYSQWMSKLAQYATVNQNRERLVLTHQPTYFQGEEIALTAQVFNANFEVVTNAQLQLQLQGNGVNKLYDLRNQGEMYTQEITQLAPGRYNLQLSDKKQGLRVNSTLEVVPFNQEQLAIGADFASMKEVAEATSGTAFTADQHAQLIQTLLDNPAALPREKMRTVRDSLLDNWWILLLLASTLAIEWFLRKYRGWV